MSDTESSWITDPMDDGKADSPGKGEQRSHLETDKSDKTISNVGELDEAWISAPMSRENTEPLESGPSVFQGYSWRSGDVIHDDFRVERELGRGGMGMVYLVSSLSTGDRFAVKRALFQGEKARLHFLSELKIWRSLPEHPHLAVCRFFRTVGNEVVIFAEYMEGGSLDRWIMNGRGPLYEGEFDAVLSRILSIAIQTAQGLHALHERGLSHQDVKPANMLLSQDGFLAKVSDFGLARLHMESEDFHDTALQTSRAKYTGMTRAFCSPEQKARERISHTTDVWSWGLSVLQMFVGKVWWEWGTEAEQVLRSALSSNSDGLHTPVMPVRVANILQKCFIQDPAKRWDSLSEAAGILQEVLAKMKIDSLSPPTPRFPCLLELRDPGLEPWSSGSTGWRDPQLFLAEAFGDVVTPVQEVGVNSPEHRCSSHDQAITDLTAYEEILGQLIHRIASGDSSLQLTLATAYVNKALVHWSLRDSPGELSCYDRAIEIYERLIEIEGRGELATDMARAYHRKANALYSLGEFKEVLALNDRAIEIYERLVVLEAKTDLRGDLAWVRAQKAAALREVGERREASAEAKWALEVLEEEVGRTGRGDLQQALNWAKGALKSLW